MYEGEYTMVSRLLVSEVLHDLAGLLCMKEENTQG
jgi:hypothetical protein